MYGTNSIFVVKYIFPKYLPEFINSESLPPTPQTVSCMQRRMARRAYSTEGERVSPPATRPVGGIFESCSCALARARAKPIVNKLRKVFRKNIFYYENTIFSSPGDRSSVAYSATENLSRYCFVVTRKANLILQIACCIWQTHN